MKSPLLYILEVLFCSGMLLAFYRLLLVRKVAFVHCRRFLVAAVVLSVLIPALDIPLYPARTVVYPLPLIGATQEELPPETVAESAPLRNGARPAAEAPRTVGRRGVPAAVSGLLYAGTVLLLLGVFLGRIRNIRRLRRHSRLSDCGAYTLAESAEVAAPFSFLRTIFMGEGYEGRRRDIVLAHESSHVRHRHSAERIVVEAVRSLFWFNPFVWLAGRWLEEVQEWEADRDVLDAGYDLTEYRTIIFRQLFGYNPDIACGLNHSFTKNRFTMMTQFRKRRFAFVRLSAAVPIVAGMMMLCSFTTRAADPVAAAEAADMGRPVPDLSGLKPVPVLCLTLSMNLESNPPRFGLLEYLPVDESRYRLSREKGMKITDPSGKDISWWAWKHYGVKAENPMFLIDGELMTREEYADREGRRMERDMEAGSSSDQKIYTGAEVAARLGDPTVDALVVVNTTRKPSATIHVSSTGILLNGKPVSIGELAAMIAEEREKLSEEARPKMTVVLQADPDTRMGEVNQTKQALRRANALRLRYEVAGQPEVFRLLPPDPRAAGADIRVKEMVLEGAAQAGDIMVRKRNMMMVLVNGGGEILAGGVGNLNPVGPDGLKERVREFVLNPDHRADLSEQKLCAFDLPDDRGTMSYPVSEGVVVLQSDENTSYERYVAVQNALSEAFGSIRSDLSQRQFHRPYTALTPEQRQVINRAVPMKISEAEPRTRKPDPDLPR